MEEQFYLLWPALIIGVAWLVRRRTRHTDSDTPPSATPYLVLVAVVAAVSFAVSLDWTRTLPPWAFFSLPARAWKLAVGGVRQNVLYHHFASKDDILGTLLEALIRPALDAACALSTCPTNDEVDRAARLYALSLYDSQVLATWKWNLGVPFFLPEAHSAVFDSP